MARYNSRYSQFGVVGGQPQSESDLVLAAQAPGMFSPEARKGHLYIVTETPQEGAVGREACQMVIQTIRKVFYGDTSFSVTSALRKAVIAANEALYQQNFGAPPPRRALVGLTCVVIKDGDLYAAQVAPGQLYLLAGGRQRAIPPMPAPAAQVASPLSPTSRALGSSLTTEPELFRAVVGAGDCALICSSSLAPHLALSELRDLVAPGVREAADALHELCSQRGVVDAQGILIELRAPLSPAAQAAPLSGAGLSERGRMLVRGAEARVARLASELTLLVRGPAERLRRARADARVRRDEGAEGRLHELPELPSHSPNPPPLPRQIDLGESLDERIARARAERRQLPPKPAAQARRLPPSALLGEGGMEGAPVADQPIAQREHAPYTPGAASGQRRAVPTPFGDLPTSPLGRLRSYLTRRSRARHLRRPPQRGMPHQPRQTGLSYRRERPPFPWLPVLLLVTLVLTLVLYGTTLNTQNQLREADDTLAQAEQAVSEIFAAPDESTAELRLAAAAEAIAAVRATGTITGTAEGRQRFEALEREYDQALSAIRKISYFDTLEVVATNPQPEALFDSVIVPPAPRGITDTLAFSAFYMLDANTGTLYRKPKVGGAIEPILRPTDQIGPLTVGRVLGATWRFDTIVAVSQSDEGGPYNFYFRANNAWSYSILAGSDVWGRPGDRFRIANYEGNLYVWGADPSNILRYRSGAYGEFPDPWVQSDGGKQFASSLDMAIDGKIYLLQPDGRVLVFASNDAGERAFEREIVPAGIEPPITGASRLAITGGPDEGFIFLVDSFYSRIIQLDKRTGALIQQIKARPDSATQLTYLSNLGVDTTSARPILYLVNGAQIVRAPLPDQPTAFRDDTPTPTSAPTPTRAEP